MSEPLSDFRSQSAHTDGTPENPYRSSSPPEEAPVIEQPAAPTYSPLESQIAVLMQQGRRGAGWFYSIAGFSIINSLIMLVGGGTFFVIGLGITLISDVGALQAAGNHPEKAVAFKAMAFVFDLFVAGIVCGFGWLSVKRWQPVFILGMLLYLLDGLLFLMFGQIMAVAFHAYGLYCMWSGLNAYRQLAVLERKLMDPLHPAGMFNPHQPLPTESQ